MLRSTIEASVRRTSVWSRISSPSLAGKQPACRLLPAVTTKFQRHELHFNSSRVMSTQNETSVHMGPLHLGRSMELGPTLLGAGLVRLLHKRRPAGQQDIRDGGCIILRGEEKSYGFTAQGHKWIARGPTDKDGPGYVYVMSEVDAKIPHTYKIGFTKLDPELRVAQLARKNRKMYETECYFHVRYHKNTEKALLEDLRARGMGLPPQKLPCGKTEPGGTEWVRGEDVIDISKCLMNQVKQLDKKGSRSRK